MTNTDWTELREKAEAATPGPWYRKDAESNGTYGIEYIDAVEGNPQSEGGFSDIANCSEVRFWKGRFPQNVEPEQRKANAAFIAAANPATVLALLSERDELAGERDRLDAECDEQMRSLEQLQHRVNTTTQVVANQRDEFRAEAKSLRARNEELSEALKWYASIHAWKGQYIGRDRRGLSEYDTSPASRDLGERAREALRNARTGEGGE